MAVTAGNTPVSWGVHYPDDPRNEPWRPVFEQIAEAGYRDVELGALGYLPTDPGLLREHFEQLQLNPTAMYVFQPAQSDRAVQADVVDRARRSCELLAAVGGRFLLIIDERNPVRIPTAGRRDAAQPLDDAGFEQLVADISEVAEAALECGIQPALHPHVAGYVEFEDEIERALAALDPELVKLCIDTGHCAYAGIDPSALFARHAERVVHLHLKDVDEAVLADTLERGVDFDTAMLNGIFCPIGQGVVDFQAYAAALAAHGYAGSATVEQDHEPSDPEKAPKAFAGAVRSLAFLREIGLVAAG